MDRVLKAIELKYLAYHNMTKDRVNLCEFFLTYK